MKTSFQVIIVLFILINGFAVTYAQNNSDSKLENWKKIDLPLFSFSAPKNIKNLKSRGIHSQIWQYENEDIFLSIELGDYVSPQVGGIKENISFLEKFIEVGGENAYLVFYKLEDPDEEYKYASEIYFSFNNKKTKLSLKVFSKFENDQKSAEKIFMSVQFKGNFK